MAGLHDDSDFEVSFKNRMIARSIGGFLGLITGPVIGLAIGFAVGGPVGLLVGMGMGLILGPIFGIMIMATITASSHPKSKTEDREPPRDPGVDGSQETHSHSRMNSLLRKEVVPGVIEVMKEPTGMFAVSPTSNLTQPPLMSVSETLDTDHSQVPSYN